MSDNLKYPVGKFQLPGEITPELLKEYIKILEEFPKKLAREVDYLSEKQLATPYRPGGWTVRQLVNHLADSHLNSFIRYKLALTEKEPTIKPYNQSLWAELADSSDIDINPALKLLSGLHARWTFLLGSLSSKQLGKSFIHPESGKKISLKINTAIYAWHCEHHLAHITALKERENW